jgi:hypothetical protein
MSFLRERLSGKFVSFTVGVCDWIASDWLVQFAITLLFFKTTPVLKVFSSDPDGMPLFEAWWLK